MEEVPGLQLPLLALDDEQADPGHDEEPLLGVLAVVHPQALPWLKHVDVDAELWEASFALEGAEDAERAGVAPAVVARVHHEPAVAFRHQAVFRHPQRRFGDHGP